MNQIQESIFEAMDILVNHKIKKLSFDTTVTGRVKAEHEDGLYTVTINDYDTKIKARPGLVLQLNDIVYIKLVRGNFSEKFIDCKRP